MGCSVDPRRCRPAQDWVRFMPFFRLVPVPFRSSPSSRSIRWVSRATPRDASRHVILGTQTSKPRDFASQNNVNLANGWGIVRTIADLALKQPEGKYVLLKDPNKVSLNVSCSRRIELNSSRPRMPLPAPHQTVPRSCRCFRSFGRRAPRRIGRRLGGWHVDQFSPCCVAGIFLDFS